ncbi:MAP7 domain-containing protein 1-like [Schistocerca cancellata]|uniref:MAP7 domain-containing protein 1-like n=1 Tax=Schistocerca cancellata TaxID=274614 RepID=UPI0021197394|nr:MAP7 domain-containing protein 1-like [Schistocerca cancellata]
MNLNADFPSLRIADSAPQPQGEDSNGNEPAAAGPAAATAEQDTMEEEEATEPAAPATPGPEPAAGPAPGSADKRKISDGSSDEAEQQVQPKTARTQKTLAKQARKEKQPEREIELMETEKAENESGTPATHEQAREQKIRENVNQLKKILKLNQEDDVAATTSKKRSGEKAKGKQRSIEENTKTANKTGTKKERKRQNSSSSQERRQSGADRPQLQHTDSDDSSDGQLKRLGWQKTHTR